jgi:hypothetical protein
MQRFYLFLFVALVFSQQQSIAQATWPREIPFTKTGGKVIIYQPQPDALEGNTLIGRAAIAGKEKASDELVFGAIFYEAKLTTDKATRMAYLESIKITNVKVKGVDDLEKIKQLISLIETEVPKWEMEISLDQLVSTIKKEHPDAPIYNNVPPKVIYREKPTSLVIIDGEPKIQKDKDLDADRVVNTPNLVFKEGSQWNMYNGGIWYKSNNVLSGWTASTSMSKKVSSINDQIKKQEKENNDNKEVTGKPEVTDIVVSTEPAELLQTKGAPVYKKIDSTSLQYVSNTDNDIIKNTDGQIFILIAGRWYRSASFNGPWVFNEPDKLPADFSKIPEGSEKDNVLVSVSGTEAAEEAMIDSEIPQTAKVERKTATVKVEYDGEPKFEAIQGSSLQLGINSNLTVLKDANRKYFALDNGVWFIGDNAKGPWKVSDTRPLDIDNIPASSAAYNSKFVQVYESTPEYVLVGYTAGYLGSYIQGDPVIVFGTGYHYQPWYGSVYYPRPTTWGFGFSYNPWTGWSMGVGFNIGFLHVGFNFGGGYYGGGGWFGPPMYYPPYRPPMYGGGYYGNRPGGPGYRPGGNNVGNNFGNNNGNTNITINNNQNNLYRPNNRPGNNDRPGIVNRPDNNNNNRPGSNYRPDNNNNNSNNRPGNNNNKGGNGVMGGNNNNNNNRQSSNPSTAPNNVFADKDGNVFQKDKNGTVNQRDNSTNTWKKTPESTINRDAQSRDRGNQRTNNFNNATKPPVGGGKPAGSNTRPAGATSRPAGTTSKPAGATSRPAGGGGGTRRGG